MNPSMAGPGPNPVGPTGVQPGKQDPNAMAEQIMSQIPPEVLQQFQQMPAEKIMMLLSQLLVQSGIPQDMATYMAKLIAQKILAGGKMEAPMAPEPSLAGGEYGNY